MSAPLKQTAQNACDPENVRKPAVRSAIFDIDGTLLDSLPVWNDLGARYLRHLGIEPAPDLAEQLAPLTIGEGVCYMKKRYGIAQSEEEIRSGLAGELDRFYRAEAVLKPGMREIVRFLRSRGIPLVLATVGDPALTRAALERLDMMPYFGKMFVCEDYGTTKREARIFQIAADFLGTAPAETLVFEDTLPPVLAASAAGFRTAVVEDALQGQDRAALEQEAELFLTMPASCDAVRNAFF